MSEPIQWRPLHAIIKTLDEPALERMLDDELRTYKREAFARRIHQRLCKLRATRERAEILDKLAS